MKKEKFILVVLAVFLLIQLTLAQNSLIDRSIEGLGEALGSIFTPIFGVGSGDFLFAKVLFFFLLFAIIYMSLNKIDLFEDNWPAHVIVTSVVSILAVRYLKEGTFIEAMLLPIGALGIAITLFLPLIIYSFFVHRSDMGGIGRKAAWFIYGVVFIVLWGSRKYNTLGNANWIYGLGIGYIILNLIFDKSIHNYFKYSDSEKRSEYLKDYQELDLLGKLEKAYSQNNKKMINRIKKDLERLRKS